MSKGRTLIVLFIALSTLIGTPAALAATTAAFGQTDYGSSTTQQPVDHSDQQANENSEADINVTFGPDCESFTVESSKDISFVSINNNTTFTYVKYEDGELSERDEGNSSDATTFTYTGDEEIKSIVVKSGTTTLVFNCPEGGGDVDADPDEEPECSDGIDNDDDGLVDHPEDPGCETPDDDDERDPDDAGDGDDGDAQTQCSGEGDPATVAVAGQSSGNESAENDDNMLDVNVQSESDHESDCDNIDVDAGTHNTSANNDTDDADVDIPPS